MAARRASTRLLTVMRHSCSLPPCASSQLAVIPRPSLAPAAALSSFPTRQIVDGSIHGESFWVRRLHSVHQATNDGEETEEYEKSKMTAEGGSDHEKLSFNDKAEEIKGRGGDKAKGVSEKVNETLTETSNKANETAEHAKEKLGETGDGVRSVTDTVSERASKEADTAKDMFKDMPQKVSETATGLKEVAGEAAKAVKRDAERVAEKVGLKSDKN